MSSSSDCFIVQSPNCIEKTIIIGRNAQDANLLNESQEVCFYDANQAIESEKSDGGASPELSNVKLRIILQRPRSGVWGGDYGANEENLVVAISWTSDETRENNNTLLATDIVRYTLTTTKTAEEAVEFIKKLIETHGSDGAKLNFLVCDPNAVWTVSSDGRSVTTEHIEGGHQRLPNKIENDSTDWCGDEPAGDGTYNVTNMFETLRAAAKIESRASTVSVLNLNGISCHWFTATPNANESVFKPFVFAPNAKISPLTKIQNDTNITMLHKLHAQRKPTAIEDLKALEASCVEDVNNYLSENPMANEELDELMKDCVEAEVKFYR